MNTVVAAVVLVLLLAPAVVLLERTHRLGRELPHGPRGAEADPDLARLRAEVEAVRAHAGLV